MDYHKNARSVVWSREQMARRVLEQGFTYVASASAAGVSAKTAAKWTRRYQELGLAGLRDRSCRPLRLRRPTQPEQAERVAQLRHQRWAGSRIAGSVGPEPGYGQPHPAPAEAKPDARPGADGGACPL